MFWYIDRDSDVILITSKKWRKSLIRTCHTKKNKKKIGGEDASFSFVFAFLDLFPDQDILGYIFG